MSRTKIKRVYVYYYIVFRKVGCKVWWLFASEGRAPIYGGLNAHFNIFLSKILSFFINNSSFLSVFLNRNIIFLLSSLIPKSLCFSLPPSVSNVLLFHCILFSVLTDNISLYITINVRSYTVIIAILQSFSKCIFSIYNPEYHHLRRRQLYRTLSFLIDWIIKIRIFYVSDTSAYGS